MGLRYGVALDMGAWVKNMAKCLVEFGWQGMEGDAIKGTEKRYKSSARQFNSSTVQCTNC